MNFYILKPKGCNAMTWCGTPWERIFGTARGFVVRASSKTNARMLAANHCGEEGREAWIMSEYSTCEKLNADDPIGVIMTDYIPEKSL